MASVNPGDAPYDDSADEQLSDEHPDDAVEETAGEGEPDVLLNVPNLSIDEITLEVEDLRAHISLQAEILDVLKLNVGADVILHRVALKITGVQARALLKVRLDRVAKIIDRVLDTVDRNPQILEQAGRTGETDLPRADTGPTQEAAREPEKSDEERDEESRQEQGRRRNVPDALATRALVGAAAGETPRPFVPDRPREGRP